MVNSSIPEKPDRCTSPSFMNLAKATLKGTKSSWTKTITIFISKFWASSFLLLLFFLSERSPSIERNETKTKPNRSYVQGYKYTLINLVRSREVEFPSPRRCLYAETKNIREQRQNRNKIGATPLNRPEESGPKHQANWPPRAHPKDNPCAQKIRPLCRKAVTQGK